MPVFLLSVLLAAQEKRVHSVRVQVLSTMLADAGIGEWGFAALVEVDGRPILFDTGARPDTVLKNAAELKVDLTAISDVILSHNHLDHTGGLITLRRDVMRKNPEALSRAHVGKGIFLPRKPAPMLDIRKQYEATAAKFVEYDAPVQLWPGVWLTGPVPRVFPERNWSGPADDNIPEDQSLVIDTDQGLVVVSGCGHAGVINTLTYAREKIRKAPVHALVGGLHLFEKDDKTLEWTGAKLREFGLAQFLGAHCTGIEAVYRLRQVTGLTRRTAAVAAVGATFVLGGGIDPGPIAR